MTARMVRSVLVGVLMLFPACGSDDTGTASGPSTFVTEAPSASSPVTTRPIVTTPFTFPPRDTTPFAPGKGTLTVTGDQQATGQFSSTSCPGIRVTEPRGVIASLAFVSNPGLASAKRWVVDLAGMSPRSTTFPEPGGFNQRPPRRIRLSVESIGQVLTWGTTADGEGTVTGTVTANAPDAKSGTFDLQLGFAGSEGNTVPLSSHGPVQIKGDWDCGTS